MTLSKVRNEFVNQSGRLDLINEDGSNNGADFYINAGQMYLDRLVEKHADIGRVFRVINNGDYFVKFRNCRAIHNVGVGTAESFNYLNRFHLQQLREKYNKPFEFLNRSTPVDFAPAYIRPSGTGEDFDGIVGYMDVMEGWKDYNGIILLPPANQQLHVEVWGKFYSNQLENDNDVSFWTENFSYVLVMAAQRSLEVFYRNSQGVKDWTAAIQSELFEVEKDFIEETYFDFNQMEG